MSKPFAFYIDIPKPKAPFVLSLEMLADTHQKIMQDVALSFDLLKAEKLEDEDGLLTKRGMAVARQYAQDWVQRNVRNLELERTYPEFTGLFYDIRVDPDLAALHAAG